MFVAVVQARMGSKRLPGKALCPLRGQPMILRQLERLKAARSLSRIMVATSIESADDGLAAYLLARGQAVFRGAPTDLLDRFVRCAEAAGPISHVVRIKGDAPFTDPAVIDAAVRLSLTSGADYVSNRLPASYPRGLEVEVIALPALQWAAAQPRDALAPTSPTALIRDDPRFTRANLASPRDLTRNDWRVKTPADLAFARSVYDALHPADPLFSMSDVLDMTGGRQDVAKYTYAA